MPKSKISPDLPSKHRSAIDSDRLAGLATEMLTCAVALAGVFKRSDWASRGPVRRRPTVLVENKPRVAV